ncbi:MAG: endonuclease/exonuclease/phosphatase family protein [Muribaculaceae bacterium]|nr:endonuclease/exonuclease/phosphatase family protein [Muribaculaceae bacterium]
MKRLFKFILSIINIAVVTALIFSGYGGHFNPETSSIPGIALMLFPAILLATILLMLADLILCRRMAFVPAFALLICAVPIWNFCPVNINTPYPKEDTTTFTLLTYNTYNFDNFSSTDSTGYNSTIATILDSDADIVCLQEALENAPSAWTQYGQLTDSILSRYPHRLHGPKSLTIWSRYPLTNVMMTQPDDPSGMFMCAKVDINGSELTLYNVHLQSLGLSNTDKELYGSITRRPTTHKLETARNGLISKLSQAMKQRALQARSLRSQIDSIQGSNIIVAGDFNDIEDCYAQRLIEGKNLHSVFSTVGCGPTMTYYANRFFFNIDHILYGGGIQALGYHRGNSRASDHYPVSGTFTIPGQPSLKQRHK